MSIFINLNDNLKLQKKREKEREKLTTKNIILQEFILCDNNIPLLN